MKKLQTEFFVGLFVLIGIACLAYLSIRLAKKEVWGGSGCVVSASFSNCGGLKPGSTVAIAGVEVGRVKKIVLDDYRANVIMQIDGGVELQEDAIASIKTKGLIGEKFIAISPGGSDEMIENGGVIMETEPAMDIESLVSKFVHGKVK